MRISTAPFTVLLAIIAFQVPARADWVVNGIPISVTANGASGPACVSDGAGGAIICWTEARVASSDILAQRVDGFGNALWTPNGVLVCSAVGDQTSSTLIADGAGGAIIAWRDARSGPGLDDIYLQRVNASGAPLWTANGVALCTAANLQLVVELTSDGAGGAIATWQDLRSGTNYDAYARRINSAGTPQWVANGVAICALASNQTRPKPVPDGAGGAIISWADTRNPTTDIFAQRVNAAGATQWVANGVAVCTEVGSQSAPDIVSDNGGGAIIAWSDERTSVDDDIYAQRINGAGVPQWMVNGVYLSAAAGVQSNHSMVPDGAGGAIVAWQDSRTGPLEVDLYAQRVNALGAALWDNDGLPICIVTGTQGPPSLAADGQGGVVAMWSDNRILSDHDIFTQMLSAEGTVRWPFEGVFVCAAIRHQDEVACVADGAGGIIAAWGDDRSFPAHCYAQRIELRYGYWGRPEPTIVSASDNPNDQGGQVIVRWDASQRDLFFDPGISHYSLWRATDFVATQAAAASMVLVDHPSEVAKDFGDAAIWKEITPSGPVYWEWIANQPAVYQDTYSMLARTRQDGALAAHYFKVIAHEVPTPPSRAWESSVVSGFSLDNLAPPAPIELAGAPTPWDITLTWESGGPTQDFSQYVIYRGSGFVLPLPQYRVGVSTSTHHVDVSVPNGYLQYIVTAMDTHGNESAPSNVWSPGGTTPVHHTPALTRLTVRPNRPNPFSDTTSFEIGLPSASDVTIEVFDVAGRRVATTEAKGTSAGWTQLPFSGQDERGRPLASGVYFFKVTASAQTVTQKMVIAR